MQSLLTDPVSRNALLTASALACAGAVLSVIVVLRRWAFIGEGIGHSGFGGAGTAWLLALVFPALDLPWVPYAAVVVFCLLTSLAMGKLARGSVVDADAAIGIFLVASLAWGFVAQHVYTQVRHAEPTGFSTFLFGQMKAIGNTYATSSLLLCAAVMLTCAFLWKEIVAYAFDPLMAQTSGVRAGFVHYLLMLLLAVLIVIGVKVAGSVLVTAFLVLPGATGLALSRDMRRVLAISITSALLATLAGLSISTTWQPVPAGPAIVLSMFLIFMLSFTIGRFTGTAVATS